MDTILATLIIVGAGLYLFIKAKNRLGNKPGSNPCDGCAGCGPQTKKPGSACAPEAGKEQKITWH